MDPQILKQIALGIVPPGLAGAALFLALFLPTARAPKAARWQYAAASIGLAVLYIAFHAWLLGGVNLPPARSTDWLAISAIAAAVAALPSALGAPGLASWPTRIAALALIGFVSARGVTDSWPIGQRIALIAAFAAAACVVLWLLEWTDRRIRGPVPVMLVSLLALGANQVLVLGFHSLLLSQSAGLCAALMGGAALVALLLTSISLAGGIAVVPVMITAASLFHGLLFTETDHGLLLAGLVAASPLGAAIGCLGRLGRIKGIGGGLMRLAFAAAPIGAAMIIILLTQESPQY
ncbi:MAG: hypothetical protein KF745_09120 [Phycisphaeraceae bacterium]|nr:hypothetical protein [Phycisphaeraceae bacterium]